MTKLAIVLAVALAACGRTSTPAHAPQRPTPVVAAPAPVDLSHLQIGELKVVNPENGASVHLHADGGIGLDNDADALIATPDGKLRVKASGEDLMQLMADGSIQTKTGTLPPMTITADGTLIQQGRSLVIDDHGIIAGDAGGFRVEGATTPALKRTAWFLMMGLALYSQTPSAPATPTK